MHALRFNRFLLDDILNGDRRTPVEPLIPHCVARKDAGSTILARLLKWWQTGTNTIAHQRPTSLSALPDDVSLIDAEDIARQRERGDGGPQRSLPEQITAALQTIT